MTSRAVHDRLGCCVGGCSHGTRTVSPVPEGHYDLETGEGRQWVCGTHWRRVPRSLKRRRSTLFRQWRRRMRLAGVEAFWALPPGSPERIALVRTERLIRATWRRCVCFAEGEAGAVVDGLPEAMGDELRKLGL